MQVNRLSLQNKDTNSLFVFIRSGGIFISDIPGTVSAMIIRRLPAAIKFPSAGATLSEMFPYGWRLKDDDHAGKRRRRRSVAEAQASAYKPDFTGPVVDELVKIAGVGPGGNKQYDRRSGFSGLTPAFEYPIINRPSVRRIAENRLFGPVLLQPVVRYGRTFAIS